MAMPLLSKGNASAIRREKIIAKIDSILAKIARILAKILRGKGSLVKPKQPKG
jgi:hypothetical protein